MSDDFESSLNTFDFSTPTIKEPVTDQSEIDGYDFSAPIQQEQAVSDTEDGFIDRTVPQLQERNERMLEDLKRGMRGEVSPQEAALNIAGELGGSFFDVVGEGLISTGRGIAEVTPDFIKDPVSEKASQLSNDLLQTEMAQEGLRAVEAGVEVYREWKAENPRVARMLENTFNIGLAFAPVKVKKGASPSRLSKSSDKVRKSAETQIGNSRKKFTEELIRPKRSLKVAEDETRRTVVGKDLLRTKTVIPSTKEATVAAEVSRIKGVKPKNTIQGNLNAIKDANQKLAKQLELDIKEANVLIPRHSVLQSIDDVVDAAVAENVFVVGTGVAAAEKMKLNAAKIILKHTDKAGNLTGVGLLNARKELDSLIKSQKPNIFNPNTAESAIEIITKSVRNTMNDILHSSVKGTGRAQMSVRGELNRQSLLFRAIDNIEPKAALEKSNAILRAMDNALKVIEFRNEAVQLFAIMAGVGGLGAAAMGAGPFRTGAGILGSVWAGKKLITSPNTKLMISKTLGFVDEAIRTTENPSMLKALRADRALIVELLENTVGEGEANKPIPEEPEQ